VSRDHFKGQGDDFKGHIFFNNLIFLNVFIFWSKRTQSRTKVLEYHFKSQGDHFKCQNFSKI